MADNEVRYIFHVTKAIRGMESRKRAEEEKRGWEFVSQTQGTLRTEMTFRRPKPKNPLDQLGKFIAMSWATFRGLKPSTQRRAFGVSGGVVALLVVIVVIASVSGGDVDSQPIASPTETSSAAPSESPSEEPSKEPSKEPTEESTQEPSKRAPSGPVTDAEVVNAFRKYLDERATAGVVIAQAVTDVSFSNRVVRVTFDPAAAGIDRATFDQINPYNNPYDPSENLADFVSTVIAFNDNLGIRLRPAIDRIETVRADGTPLGTRTTAEIIELNELEQ